MDHMSHHNWEQALDDHHHHHAHFDQSQWPYYLQTSSSPGPLLGSPGGLLAAGQATSSFGDQEEDPEEELEATKEMLFKIAAMQPVDVDPAAIRKPRRRNVRISDDPQSVAARLRRERISEKIRILQRLVPGGTKLDTASMLDEAIRYVKFLKRQIRILQGEGGGGGHHHQPPPPCLGIPAAAEDWLVVTTKAAAASSSYLFGGKNGNDNDNDDDGAGDDGMCFNHRF